jgi:cell division protein FtsB
MNAPRQSQRHDLQLSEPTRMQKALALVIEAQWWMLFAIAICFALYYYFRPLPDTREAASRVAVLEAEKKLRTEEKERVTRRIAWVQDQSTAYMELLARDWLNWQREDEIIIRLPKATATVPAEVPAK